MGLSLSRRLDLTDHDRQVRERLENLARAAAAAGVETLDHQALADVGLRDDEIVDVELVVVLGVGDRRLQALAHVLGDSLARELEIGERGRDLLAADQLGQQVELLRAHAQHLSDGLRLVLGERAGMALLAHVLTSLTRRPASARAWPCGRPSDRGTCGSARTRRTCGRPSPR